MASFKPANRFRTAAAKPLKENYTDLRVTSDKSSTSLSLATSSQFIAVPYGGGTSGSLAVLPVKYSLWSRNNNYPVVCAHGETVQDLQFNPFNPHQLATGGKDGVFKVFTIPEGGLTENLVDPTLKLTDFDGGVTSIAFHKSASGILAVGYKNGVNIVDLNKGTSAYNFKHGGGFNKDLLSVDWSYDGALLGGIGKDQAFHLFDPRSSAAEVLTTSPKIELRAQRGLFLGKDGSFVIVGANKSRQPQINIFDSRNPAKALLDTSLDFSTGTLLPLYDVDTQLMYLGIRGSAMMNVYDMSETGKITKVTQFSTPTLFQGAALLPKSTVEFKSAEINRVLKLTDTAVEQISIQIPKKIAAPFHEDLYPETASAKSDLSGEDWLAGKNALPTLVNIQTLASVPAAEEKAASPAPQSSPSASPSPSPVPAASPRSPEPPKTETPKVIFNKSDNRKQLEAAMKKSPFTHISGTEPNSINAYYYDIAADLNMTLARNLRVNSKYWAVAWKTIGGSGICVHPHGAFGRIGGTGVSPPLIRGHSSQVTCFDLSTIPSQSSLLASGSGDCHVRLFTIPDEGVKEDIKEGVADFSLGGRITTTDFNPYVDGILTASHSAFDGHFLSIFDINANKTASTISFFQDSVIDVSFNPLGSLFGVTSKDKKSRIIDPRANSVAQEFEPVESQRDTRILWSSGTRVVTAGFGKFSQRSIALWDLAKLDKPLKQQEIDTSNSTLLPILDADTQILYVASNGSRIVRPFHITNDTFEPLAQFVSGGDMFGFAMKPKSSVDVKAVEVGAAVSIFNSDKVMPISFKIPRKRVEYFQDDVFPPSRSAESLCSAEAWLGGAQFTESDIKTVSLCPAGMTPLSAAPPEEMTERQMKYQNVLAQKAAPKPKGILGHESADEVRDHFRNIAQTMPTSNRWDARAEDSNDVDDSEW